MLKFLRHQITPVLSPMVGVLTCAFCDRMDIGARVQTTCNPVKIALVLVSGLLEDGRLVSTNYIENFSQIYPCQTFSKSGPTKTKQRQLNNSFLYSTSKLSTYRPIVNAKHTVLVNFFRASFL